MTPPRVVLLSSDGTPEPANLAVLQTLADLVVVTADRLVESLPGADALLLWDFFSGALQEAWPAADRLRWVHVAAAGVDTLLFDALRESDVMVTNAHGVFDDPIAEYVLTAVLAHDKRWNEHKALQAERRWKHHELRRTRGRCCLVVGTGGIGRATARLLRAVGCEVRGAGRREVGDDPDFGQVVATDRLAQEVGWADHVVLVAPLTPRTRGLVTAEVLGAMRPTAHLVNVGRGPLVDEDALVDALHAGEIAGATLDVFRTEPLPPDSPLWDLPTVTISSHLSGDVVGWRDALADQVEVNLHRFVAGEPLMNVVDKALGYVPRPRS